MNSYLRSIHFKSIDDKLFETCSLFYLKNSQWLETQRKRYSNILMTFTPTNQNQDDGIKRNQYLDFISFNSPNMTIYKYLLYYYNNDNQMYFFEFIIKSISVFGLIFLSCLINEIGTYLHHQHNLVIRKISILFKVLYNIIRPFSIYKYEQFSQRCSRNLISKLTSSLLNDIHLLTDEDKTISELNHVTRYSVDNFAEDLFYGYITYFFNLNIWSILIGLDTYIVNIKKSILIKILSLFTGIILIFPNLSTVMLYNYRDNNIKNNVKYTESITNTCVYLENIIKSKDSLQFYKFKKKITKNINLLLRKNETYSNSIKKKDLIQEIFIKIPTYICSLILMIIFNITLSASTITFQDRMALYTNHHYLITKKVVYSFGVMINKYIRQFCLRSDHEEKCHQIYLKHTNIPNLSEIVKFNQVNSIRLERISYAYNSKQTFNEPKIILKDFSLNINKPGLYIILGESGKGKTSLLNIVVGFINPDSGKIIINDQFHFPLVLNKNPLITHISFMPQRTYIFEDTTILFNITFQTDLVSKEKHILDAVIQLCELNNLIQEKGIDYKIRNHPSNISEGQKKRICLARTLYEFELSDKSVLVVDEPTTGLEPVSSQKIINNLSKYYSNTSKIIICGLHNGILNTEDNIESSIHYIEL